MKLIRGVIDRCFGGSLCYGFFALLFMGSVSAGESVDASLPAVHGGEIHIELYRGKVRLVGWDKQKISIRGTLDEQAEKLLFFPKGKITTIQVKLSPHVTNQPEKSQRWRAGDLSDLQIYVPKRSLVRFAGGNVDFRASNIRGGLKVDSDAGHVGLIKIAPFAEVYSRQGNIQTQRLDGRVRLRTLSGDIRDKDSSGDLDYLSLTGDIDVDTEESHLNAETRSGDIKLHLQEIKKVNGSSDEGRISVQASLLPEALVNLSSTAGHISLSLPPESDARFELKSSAGQINNSYNTIQAESVNGEPGHQLHFSSGNGKGTVTLNSIVGNIILAER